jgi:hypothetical protein
MTRIDPLLMLGALLLAAAPVPTSAVRAAATRGFVLTTDYSTGTLGVVDLDTRAVTPDVAVVSSDPFGRWYKGLLYVVNRYGFDNVQVIDPAQGYATVRQFSVGNGSNPQDIAFASETKAYVSRLGSPDLLIVDPASGAGLGTISLAGFADADGIPEAAQMTVVGDLLFVALARLTNFVPADTGLVAVVDMRADTVLDVDPVTPGRQALRLHGLNPSTDFAVTSTGTNGDTHLWIGCTGRWGDLDGGVEEIVVPGRNLQTSELIRSAGFAITEAALGGDATKVVMDDYGHAYAIVDAGGITSLVSWDPSTGARTATVYSPGQFSISDAALDGRSELYVCNSNFVAPGLYVFAVGPDTLLAGPLATGLPPIHVVFDRDGAPAPPPPTSNSAVALASPVPNPARTSARLTLTLARAAVARVEVFDLSGRRIRTLLAGPLPAGSTDLDWDLSDVSGRRLSQGVYFVRAMTPAAKVFRRLVVIG